MALPVSWNPFVKSKASAVTTSSTRMIISALTALISFPHTSNVGSPMALGHGSCPVGVPQVHAGHLRVLGLAATIGKNKQ